MKRLSLTVVGAAAAAAAVAAVVWTLSERPPAMGTPVSIDHAPRLSPDYAGCVIPPNIAPLNFVVKEPGTWYHVRISADKGEPIEITGRSPGVVIPVGAWKRLLDVNRGGKLTFDVCVQHGDGTWRRFAPVVNTIASEEIDGYLVYRLIHSVYSIWQHMAIHQRNLENYEETVILDSDTFGGGCVNCHTFHRNLPDRMAMNVRGGTPTAPPGGMLLAGSGRVHRVVNTTTAFNPIPAIYLAWHPSGRAIAFSTNKIVQGFHSVGENRHVFDHWSDLALYLPGSNTVTTTPEISVPDLLETYPAWSPDGKHLYFCRGPRLPIDRYREVRYDLMRIAYDIETDAWGRPETVVPAAGAGRSVTHPRISPDGRWLLFCMCDYGNFSIYQPSSDLYLMDMETGRHRRLAINSDSCESWHSWSSNSRWIVFSSKRRDGLLARPYFSYVDEKGTVHRPVVLPQKDPAFYDAFLKTYNVPELIREPVRLTERGIARALYSPGMTVKARLDPRVVPQKPVGPDARDTRYEPGPGG